jgi:hypothetical protein
MAYSVHNSFTAMIITSTTLVLKALEAKYYISHWQWRKLRFLPGTKEWASTGNFYRIFRCEYSKSNHTCHWQSKPVFHQSFYPVCTAGSFVRMKRLELTSKCWSLEYMEIMPSWPFNAFTIWRLKAGVNCNLTSSLLVVYLTTLSVTQCFGW